MAGHTLSRTIRQNLRHHGFPLFPLYNCRKNFSHFSKALEIATDPQLNKYGPYVDRHSPEELRKSGATAFLSRDKMAGIAVWPDGNIRAVFKNPRSEHRNVRGLLVLTALNAGGNKLDCFDGVLRTVYSTFGFIPVARVKFDREFAPENWDLEAFGEPDIIFWLHCGDSVETVSEKLGKIDAYPRYSPQDILALPCFDSYDEAYEYRDSLILSNTIKAEV